MCDKLVAKVNRIILKTKYGTDKTELENNIPDTSRLAKKTDYNDYNARFSNKNRFWW